MLQTELFGYSSIRKFDLPQADIILYSDFFSSQESDNFFRILSTNIFWQQDSIRFYGRDILLPRLTAWYGDSNKSYTYSGIMMYPHRWTDYLLEIKERVEAVCKHSFNSVLLNFYRDGKDSVAWHSDDEPELGEHPVIASVSFGAERVFKLKPKNSVHKQVEKIPLPHGSLLLMQGKTQKYWLHEIPKTAQKVLPRINLTFRFIYY